MFKSARNHYLFAGIAFLAAAGILTGCPWLDLLSGPTASFTATPMTGLAPLAVTFTDTSIQGGAEIVERTWHFGDGGSSTDLNPVHTFTAVGTYTVSLTVVTSLGFDIASATISVTPVAAPPGRGPTASFTATPTTGPAALTVAFTNTSIPGSSAITAVTWHFDDGGSSTEQNPVHTFNTPGVYYPSLTVTTSVGEDRVFAMIDVTPAVGPTAAFTATPTIGAAPLEVDFADDSTAGSALIDAWAWDFGDGGTSTEQNPRHTYEAIGVYTVSLTVTTSTGADTATQTDCIVATGAEDAIWYVTPDGTGSGTSWEDAIGSIQGAVDAAYYAGGGEVWVAAGAYAECGGQATATIDGNEFTFGYCVFMAPGVALFGGFEGTETSIDERDWTANRTVIDGLSTCVPVLGADGAMLDGFAIRHGGMFMYQHVGMVNYGVSPFVGRCVFDGNESTGMANYLASPTVADCFFFWNGEEGMGNYDSSSPNVANCQFIQNGYVGMRNDEMSMPFVVGCSFAQNGGAGMYNSDFSGASVVECVFQANRDAGMRNSNFSSPTVFNSAFVVNGDGGMENYGYCSPTVAYCVFEENGYVGMYNASYSSPFVSNCAFDWNSQAGMDNYDFSSPQAVNCLFYYNGSVGMGNHFACLPMAVNCTFAANANAGIGDSSYTWPTLINCIVWGNGEAAILDDDKSSATVSYSCIEGGHDGTGNIAADPLFADEANWDYRLLPGSPCIDTGTADGAPGDDFGGTARPQGAGYDMGAYEYVAP